MTKTERTRTLGLPITAERALMAEAYEAYGTAQRRHNLAHNAWRRAQRKHGNDAGVTRGALTKATKAAMQLTAARAAYRCCKAAAIEAGRP